MCGRYTLRRVDLIRAALDALQMFPFEEFSERGRFNVAPSQMIPLARVDREGRRVLNLARWGLIPSWVKSMPKVQPINARAETLESSGMFRNAFEQRRCLIPADGFYEWKASGAKSEKRPKKPYFIRFRDDRTFAFAGLWEKWKPEAEAETIESCTIITTTPNELMKGIHDRMPAIVRPEDYARWLDPKTPASEVRDVLEPIGDEEMTAHAVSARVNRAGNDGADLVEPVECEQEGLFG